MLPVTVEAAMDVAAPVLSATYQPLNWWVLSAAAVAPVAVPLDFSVSDTWGLPPAVVPAPTEPPLPAMYLMVTSS